MRYFIIFPFILFSTYVYSSSNEQIKDETCNTGFGVCIGQSYLTKAYSNCNLKKDEPNFVIVKNTDKQIKSGLKWQCVEYARRWLIENQNVTFPEINNAYQIWDLKYGNNAETHEQVPLLQFKNKIATKKPKVGDLLIYSTDFAVTGHVAVVVGVYNNSVTIAEQNYFNDLWDVWSYSRRLLLEQDANGRYRIFDDALIGWVRFSSSST